MVRIQTIDEQINIYMSTLKVNAIEKKDADQTLTVKDATLTGATNLTGTTTLANATITTGSLASGITFPAGGTGNAISIAIICDQKNASTDGGPRSLASTRRPRRRAYLRMRGCRKTSKTIGFGGFASRAILQDV